MKITTTKIEKPPVVCVYGTPGVGKSRFAASCPNPIFIRTEDRHDHLSVKAFDGIVDTWDKFIECLKFLANEPHDFKTVVIDTLDSAEAFTTAKVCADAGTDDILDPKRFPFYSGYARCGIIWEEQVLPLIQKINRDRKMIPMFLSHVRTDYVEHPEYGQYAKYTLGVDKRIAKRIFKICDIVGFLDWRTSTKDSASKKNTVLLSSSGKRILRLKPKPIWETKESYNLPDFLDIPEDGPGEYRGWGVLSEAIKAGIKV